MFGFGHKKKLGFNFIKSSPAVNWDIDQEIGQGSFATVYLAKKKSDGKLAALKSAILIDEESYQADTEDLVNEIKIMQMMKCDHIIKFYEAYYEDNKPPVIHLLIEYCDGKSLDTLIAARVEVSEDQLKAVLYQTCVGLAYMHDHFVIHRDIKSLNVLINDIGIIKLADFGVSAICLENKMVRSSFVGSLNWMSPEVLLTSFDTSQTYNEKCDVWSLGITAIEMAEICVPYSHLNTQSIMHRIIEGEPPKLSAPSIWSREFNDFVTNTLIKNPSHRMSVHECLQHPFLDNDAARSTAPVLELLFVQISEIIEETPDTPSPEVSNDSEDNSSFNITPDALPLPVNPLSASTIGKRTVRKTIRYKMNGEIKEKTIVEDLDDTKRLPNRKCVKDIVLDQKEFNRNIKMEHKIKKAMELQITTILDETDKRHDLEKLQVLDKMRKELDILQKSSNKECERLQAKDDGAQQKFYKKLRQEFDSQKKKILEKYPDQAKEAKKFSKSSKQEFWNQDETKSGMEAELYELSQSFLTQWNTFIESQNVVYSEMCVGHALTRNQKATDFDMEIWQTDLKHVLEMYLVKYMCELMRVNLQLSQLKKRHRREEGLISQYNNKMKEEVDSRHIREMKDAPKALNKQSNANFNEYKKHIAQDKSIPKQTRKEMLEARSAEEKLVIEKGLADVTERHELEKGAMKKRCAQYIVELATYQKEESFEIYQQSMNKRLSCLSTFENVAANKLRALYRKKQEMIKSQNELLNSAKNRGTKVMAVSFQ